MKKILALLTAALIVLSVPFIAFADVEGPLFTEFSATISNPDGAVVYDFEYNNGKSYTVENGRLDFGDEINVRYDYAFEGKKYVSFESKDKDLDGYVLSSDITAAPESVEKTVKVSKPLRYIAITEDREPVQMYKEPSEYFGTVNMKIPYGAEITVTHRLEKDSYESMLTWGYTTYNGVSGWVYLYNFFDPFYLVDHIDNGGWFRGKITAMQEGLCLASEPCRDYDEADTLYGFNVNSNITKYQKVSGPIPVGTELTFSYCLSRKGYYSFYTEYNGAKGWITYRDFGLKNAPWAINSSNAIFTGKHSFTMLDAPSANAASLGKTIPENTVIYSDYEYTQYKEDPEGYDTNYYVNFRRVSYDGVIGWIDLGNIRYPEIVETSIAYSITKTEIDLPLGKTPSYSSETAGTVKSGETVYVLFDPYSPNRDYDHSWAFIVGENAEGWITSTFVNNVNDLEDEVRVYRIPAFEAAFASIKAAEESTAAETTTEAPSSTGAAPADETAADTTAPADASEEISGSSSTPKRTVLLCAAGVAVVVLTAVVAAILINKKKNG